MTAAVSSGGGNEKFRDFYRSVEFPYDKKEKGPAGSCDHLFRSFSGNMDDR